jgi:hypothetical protein
MKNLHMFLFKLKSTLTKVALLTGFIAMMSSPVFAQISDDARGHITFGLKAGINYANVWNSSGQEFTADPKFGFAGGLFLGIPITQLLAIQPEILISQKGYKGEGLLLGTPYQFAKTATYVDVPLFLVLQPSKSLSIVVGPQYSYLLQEKYEWSVNDNTTAHESEFAKDDIRKSLFGFVFGLDLNFNHLVLSGRAGWDFLANHEDGTSNTPQYKNQWLQFTLGYRI